MTTILTSEEVAFIQKQASMYAGFGADYRRWCPIVTIPEAYVAKHYVLERFEAPALSKTGQLSMGVTTARTEGEAKLVWMSYSFEYLNQDLEIARRAGVPLESDDLRIGMGNMDLLIEQLILQGLSNPIAINGMMDSGEDVNDGLDDDYWNTVGEPVDHILSAYTDLLDNGFPPPYIFIGSWNLAPGLATKHNAAADLSAKEYISKAFQIEDWVFADNGTDGVNPTTIHPLPAALNDEGVWIVAKRDVANWALLETRPPEVDLNPVMDRDSMSFKGHLRWHGTFRVSHAGSIVYEPDVDLVTA